MEQIDYDTVVKYLDKSGLQLNANILKFNIPNAKDILLRGIKYFVGTYAEYIPEYDEIVKWMSDNKCQGLLCYGNCGRGKSLICTKILPIIFYHYYHKIIRPVDAQEMNEHVDELMKREIIIIDDFGTENISVKYGEKRLAFSEIVDSAEKKGKLLILTTNLLLDEIADKYGERTMDRLVSLTYKVKFIGKSLRK